MKAPRKPGAAALALAALVAVLPAPPCEAQEKPAAAPVNVPALIDRLTEVAECGIGYSATVSGSAFSPLDGEGQIRTMLLFQEPPVRSETMRQLVRQGAAAVPHLLAHLNDRRPTRFTVRWGWGNAVFLGEPYGKDFDRNERTDKPPPAKDDKEPRSAVGPPYRHTVTVGDLCFVAVGQIVNRNYNAVRYQPTACIVINSPTRSASLRKRVQAAWGGLTREKHRASLVADFLRPDHEERRIGACKRLAYYYPDALEPLALEFLARPSYDTYDLDEFVRERLYKARDAREARALFDAYLARHGPPYRVGIMVTLFQDLGEREEGGRTEYGDRPRRLLMDLYGKPKGVKSADRPPYPEALSILEKVELIEEGLLYDHSRKIDRAVARLLASAGQDDTLALACMKRLVARGYDAAIEKYCTRRLKEGEKERAEELRAMLAKLGWTPLHVAVERGDLDGLRALLSEKGRVDQAGRDGRTPLHLAAAADNVEAVRTLVAAKATLDARDRDGLTPAQLAVRADCLGAVEALVGAGCAVPDVLVAACAGKAERVGELLRKDRDALRAATESGLTALHLAAHFGRAEAAERLVKGGAAVEALTKEGGWTPLQIAAGGGQLDVVRVLLRARANVRAAQAGSGAEALHLAAHAGHAKVVGALLDAGAAVGAGLKETGRTPLHLAAEQGHAAVVDLLLRRGAAAGAADKGGQTPLHLAAEAGRTRVVERLLAARAPVNIKDKYSETPLHHAAEEGHEPVVRLLLAAKADAQVKDWQGQTPLDLARAAKDARLVRLLEEHSGKR